MTAIIDYGVGNLFSLKSSFGMIGEETVITNDPEVIAKADRIILPGVGAFGDAADKLHESGMDAVIKAEVKKGKPMMGICLGMQLLFEKSYEYGEHHGLGLLKGEVVPISELIPQGLTIPHMGWNALIKKDDTSPLLREIEEGECVYFVHSFAATGCEDSLLATAEYGAELTACVGKGNVWGCQFHPEKSGKVGLKILKAFTEIGG